MKAVGIICEYNPFHNGHLYHINQIKKLYPDYQIVLVMSGYFTERGEVSILTKWEKTHIALEAGVDVVVELPFIFASESADTFALGAVKILNDLQVEYLVFGSECNDINKLSQIASLELDNNLDVKKYLDLGYNYPTSLSLAIKNNLNIEIKSPNDLLGICYIKVIKNLKSSIKPITILRTNDYFKNNGEIKSAYEIRNLLKTQKNVSEYVPKWANITNYYDQNDLFRYFKYKLLSENNLSSYLGVDEGIGNLMLKNIDCNSFDEFVKKVKTKRYTYNRISRIYIHILCNVTKEESKYYKNNIYIRLLGFSNNGQMYLNTIKKSLKYPLVVKYSKNNRKLLELDLRVAQIYSLLNPNVLDLEYKSSPIKKV